MLTTRLILESILKIPLKFWLFFVAMLILGCAIYLFKLIRLSKAGLFEIDKMTGEEFEKYLEILFRKYGYSVTHVGASSRYKGDYGSDLIIEKGGIKTAVQAKRWKGMVTEKAVQEVVSAKAVYGCSNAVVVTNSYFSKHASYLAKANNVELWDRSMLTTKILKINNA